MQSTQSNRLHSKLLSKSALLFGLCTVSSTAITSGQTLLSHYTLDGTTADSGSIGANGTLQGGATFVNSAPSAFSQALDLTDDANNDFMSADAAGSFGLSQMTITLWVNIQGSLSSSGDRLLSNLDSGVNGFDLRFSGSTDPDDFRLIFGVNSTGATDTSNGYGISANNSWAFVAVTFDSTLSEDEVAFFGGSETITTTQINSFGTGDNGALVASSNPLEIGGTPVTGNDRTPPAWFSDVRIYDGILSSTQIENIRLSAIPEPAHFPMLLGIAVLSLGVTRRRK